MVQKTSINDRHWGWWIFMAALFIRLLYFAWSQTSPFLYQVSTDEAFYVDYAKHLLAGQTYAYANFMDPLLSYLLVIPMLFTENMHLVRLGFVLLDSINAWLIYRVCLELTTNKKAAIVSGMIYVFYSLTVIYSVFITKSTPVLFLLLGTVYCLLRATGKGWQPGFLLAGILSALLVFFAASYVLLGAGYFVVLLCSTAWRQNAGSFLAGFLLVMVAHVAFFGALGVNKSILPTNGGIVFYISNHTSNLTGTHEHPTFVKEATPVGIYHAFRAQAFSENTALKTDRDVSAFWYQKALAENIHAPEKALQRLWSKILLMVANNEISQNFYLPYIQQETLKNLPLVSFALVFGLGVSGLLFFAPRDIRLALVLLPILVTLLTCIVFFVSARMRLPLVPFLMLGASYWLIAMQKPGVQQAFRLLFAIALALVSVVAGWYTVRPASAEDRYNLALVMLNAQMYAEAEAMVDKVLQQQTSPKALYLKALAASYQGRCIEALPIYEQLLQMHSDIDDLAYNRDLCLQFMNGQP